MQPLAVPPVKRPSGCSLDSRSSGVVSQDPCRSSSSNNSPGLPHHRRERPSLRSNGSQGSEYSSSFLRARSGSPGSRTSRKGSKDSWTGMRPGGSLASWFGESEDVDGQKRGSIFMDAEAMKERVRANLFKEQYDVSKYYKPHGIWSKIAQHPTFEKATLAIIAFNAIWIGIDTDGNGADVLLEAEPQYQIAEHSFCVFFSFELFTRFMSFQRKADALKDSWFVFDSLLVFLMVGETWIFTFGLLVAGLPGAGGLGNASILRMARLARLTRMARMARLLRAMPELMILIKGIVAATRSVLFTLLLLVLLLYVFGIAFTQLMIDTEVGEEMFGTVPASMFSLLVCGTLQDGIGDPLAELGRVHFFYGGLYLLFVLLATVTVMNMLIGVLCEVVSNVASVEREALAVNFVRVKLSTVLEAMDEDGSGTISESEFMNVLDSKELVTALHEVGVDVEGLTDIAPFLFADDEDGGTRELLFCEFMARILELRGGNLCTVKDMIEFHKFVKERMQTVFDEIRDLKTLWPTLTALLKNPDTKQIILRPTGSRNGATHQLFVTLHSDPTGQPRRPDKGLLKQAKGKDHQEKGKRSSYSKMPSIEIRIPDVGATIDPHSDTGSTTHGNFRDEENLEHSHSEDGLGCSASHESAGLPLNASHNREDWRSGKGLATSFPSLPPLPAPPSSAPSRCDSTPAQLNSALRLWSNTTTSLAATWQSTVVPGGKDNYTSALAGSNSNNNDNNNNNNNTSAFGPSFPSCIIEEDTSRLAPESPPMTRLARRGGGGGGGAICTDQRGDIGSVEWSCSPQMSVQVSVDTRLGAIDELSAVLKSTGGHVEMPRAG